MTDYRVYRLKAGEKIGIAITYMVVTAAIAVLFYDNAAVCVVGVPGLLAMFRMVSRSKCIRMQKKLNMEFKEMLLSLAANMAAGYSMEKAFVPVYQEMEGLYQGRSYIQGEIKMIIAGLEMNTDMKILLKNFAERSGLDDVMEFAKVSAVAGRSGGNLIKMMKKMVQTIEYGDDRRTAIEQVEDEIDTMVTAKQMEYNIMSAMPFVIVLYMRVCNPGYMNALYGNVFGIAAMSVCLIVIFLMVAWGRKITNIRV